MTALAAACSSSSKQPAAVTAPVPTRVTEATSVRSTTPSTTPPRWIRYTVRRGDDLGAIARRFRVSVKEIAARNRLADPDLVQIGTLLLIRRAEPLQLVVSPSVAPRGQRFAFTLHGAIPGEQVTFTIDSPTGRFGGSPHEVDARGIVRAFYSTTRTDRAGIYGVTARGDQTTNVHSAFIVA